MKSKIFSLITIAFILFAIPSCSDDDSEDTNTCSNGIQDGTETGVDCGGDCPACANNNLTVDGNPTQATVVATLGDGFFMSNSGHPDVNGLTMAITYTIGSSGVFTVSCSNDDNTADCVHTGAYATDDNAYALNPFGFGLALYVSLFSGDDFDTERYTTSQTITLTKCDAVNHKVSGSFNLVTKNDGGQTKTFAATFTDLTYIDAR